MNPNVVNNFVKVSQEHTHVVVKAAGGLQGLPGPAGAGLKIDGSVDTYAELPWHLTASDAGTAYFVQADGLLYVWTGSRWPAEGSGAEFQGPRGVQGVPGEPGLDGEPGPANTLTIGTVQAGEGVADASITGESPNQVLNLTLPKGDPGQDSYIPDLATLKTQVLDIVYPVGSVYMSVNSVSPATFLGGTWVQLKDQFLLGAGDTYTAGGTGGAATHTHEVKIGQRAYYGIGLIEAQDGLYVEDENGNRSTQDSGTVLSTGNAARNSNNIDSINTVNHDGFAVWTKGNTFSSSSLPPYLTVYMWKRTA